MLDETARLVKPEVLTQLLREHFGTEDEVLVTGRAQSGSSNVTAFIEFGGRRLVVRRPSRWPTGRGSAPWWRASSSP